MKKLFLLLSAAAVFTLCAAEMTVKGKVNVSDFLNVRLGPGLRHPVMGRLNPEQEVEIVRVIGGWLELKAPENLKVYVSEARVGADGKLSGELNMRSRMDINAPVFGVLPKGSVVKRLEERRNGWVRIVPPETIRVYTVAVYVTFDRNQFDEKGLPLGAAPVEAPKTAEVKEDAKAVEENKVPEVKTETPAAPAKAAPAAPAAPAKVAPKAPAAPAKAAPKAPAAPAKVAPKAPAAPAKVAPKAPAAPAIPATAAAKPVKSLTGVAVKWQYAKTAETAIAFLDKPKGKNQAFVTGKTPDIQKELQKLVDSGKVLQLSGDFKAEANPPVFEVSAIKVK